MTDLPHSKLSSVAPGEKEDESAGRFTRRTVLAGAAAATAAISVGAVDGSAIAQTRQDMVSFVLLSAALSGIAELKLAPGFDLAKSEPGSDPVNVKQEYFNWVNKRRPAVLRRLLQIATDSQKLPAADRAQAIIDRVQARPDTKYLARSIVLMWYLGAWYDPDHLLALVERPNPPPAKFEVISPKAYTQGWALRVAQAHPMGFSEMQFGYWSRPPSSRIDFIGN
jgi:tellurite resistance protein